MNIDGQFLDDSARELKHNFGCVILVVAFNKEKVLVLVGAFWKIVNIDVHR